MLLIFLFDFFNIDYSEFTIGKAKYNLGDFHAFEEKYLLMENVFVDLVWMWHLYSTANVRWFSMDYHRLLLKVNWPQNNNIELTRITRRLFDFKNRWNVSLSPQSRIDVTSKSLFDVRVAPDSILYFYNVFCSSNLTKAKSNFWVCVYLI